MYNSGIIISLHGGWDDTITLTKAEGSEQDRLLLFCYDDDTNNKGGKTMVNKVPN